MPIPIEIRYNKNSAGNARFDAFVKMVFTEIPDMIPAAV